MVVKYVRGRFRAEEVAIRENGSLKIVFLDKETIYLVDTVRKVNYIFHRWFAPRKSYETWRSFRNALWKSNHKQIGWYFEEAATWKIPFTTSFRPVNLEGKKIRRIK